VIEESRPPARREPASHVVAGFLAAAALFAGLVSVIYYPGRVGPGAILVALIAAAMGGFQSRLASIAVAVATGGWFLGMVLAIILERPIF
jgi:membrane associated rhomboid family serine protease